ncbi:MAG TPA: hypothetical protein VL971_03145 [Rhizomicrobium sp.]|nr:hypothetical protein [Rhizomicrobium sp.]
MKELALAALLLLCGCASSTIQDEMARAAIIDTQHDVQCRSEGYSLYSGAYGRCMKNLAAQDAR